MQDRKGLKNRGYSREDVDDRRRAVEEFAGVKFSYIQDCGFDPESASKNIENMIGVTQIPLGFAGPVKINGEFAKGDFLVPMATTEGALIASVSRGMSVITKSGGAEVRIFNDAITRAPVFKTDNLKHCIDTMAWIDSNTDALKAVVKETTSHGELESIDKYPAGRNLFLRFSFRTGDAMGMNMATIASEAACRFIEKNTGAVLVSVSGNMCSDKKPAAINLINGRGKTTVAEVLIPEEIVKTVLRTDASSIEEVNISKNLIGSSMSGTLGANAHAANMAAAVFIATGQDPAQVVGCSMALTFCENINGDLYVSVRIPVIEVGTVGGGTRLPFQSEALKMIGCIGDGKAKKLAEIIAVTILAGEISTLAAQATGQLGSAHAQLGR
ncbi:MAG: hydroxymethylglutaryl-CoA reductase (NADPH) [Candidatus Methanomethylophilaceae archaeon]|nr:hydroxymethylglutaryl-CoA reductase (NADPH) [Candidatus Methanomethylophilaceae archaeon]